MMRRDLDCTSTAMDTDLAGSGPAAPSTLQDAPVGLQAVPGMVDGLAGEAAQAVEVPFKRVRKKMAILLMSYSGTGFNGMQVGGSSPAWWGGCSCTRTHAHARIQAPPWISVWQSPST